VIANFNKLTFKTLKTLFSMFLQAINITIFFNENYQQTKMHSCMTYSTNIQTNFVSTEILYI